MMAAPADVPAIVPPRCSIARRAFSTPEPAYVSASRDCCPPQIQTTPAFSIALIVSANFSGAGSPESTEMTFERPSSLSHCRADSVASRGSAEASARIRMDAPAKFFLRSSVAPSGTSPPPTRISVPGIPSESRVRSVCAWAAEHAETNAVINTISRVRSAGSNISRVKICW